MKYLITGGAGFIGSNLADRLIGDGHEVAVIDNLSSGKRENLNPKAKFFKIDIRDKEIGKIFKAENFDAVFHFAAHIEARESVNDPMGDAEINIIGSLNILENCRKFNIKKIIFASSGGEIYGDAGQIPTPETYPPAPISPYGIGKLTVEKYLDSYSRLFKIPYLALRFGNVYGPRQNPYGEAGVIAIFAQKMLSNGQPLIHGAGKQTKDYIYIEDALDAVMLCVQKFQDGFINIATGKETSVMDIFHKIKALTGSRVVEEHVLFPACGFQRGCLCIEKAQRELDWHPRFYIDKGLEKTVEWMKKRPR